MTKESCPPASEIDKLVAQISGTFLALMTTFGLTFAGQVRSFLLWWLYNVGAASFLISLILSLALYVERGEGRRDRSNIRWRRIAVSFLFVGIASSISPILGSIGAVLVPKETDLVEILWEVAILAILPAVAFIAPWLILTRDRRGAKPHRPVEPTQAEASES